MHQTETKAVARMSGAADGRVKPRSEPAAVKPKNSLGGAPKPAVVKPGPKPVEAKPATPKPAPAAKTDDHGGHR